MYIYMGKEDEILNYNIPLRLAELRNKHINVHYTDIIKALREQGLRVSQSEFSLWVNGVENPPRSEIIMSAADKIVAGWENERTN